MSSATAVSSNGDYQALYDTFHWQVPDQFNIAHACCGRWAQQASRVAIQYEDESGNLGSLTYQALQDGANRLSHVLQALGVSRGERVAVILPQRPETAIVHIACHQLGAIAVPLSTLFGPDALEYRLQDSEAMLAIVDQAGLASLSAIRANCPALQQVIAVDCSGPDLLDWHTAMATAETTFTPATTRAYDPAILLYTSGTTGAPKGVLLPHCTLIGNLPGFVASQNWFPQDGDVFWSPADWAETGGLMDALLPTLYFGKPIIGYRGCFSAETAFYLLEKYRVTNTFLLPNALKMMMQAVPKPRDKYALKLRAIMSSDEAVGETVQDWGQSALGIIINDMFGQTEMNHLVGNSSQRWPAKPGSMGRPYPGHRVALIDDAGVPVKTGEIGEVALHRTDIHGDPDPILFLGYWNNPQATQDKYRGNWCRTGDLALMDEDGYLWYQGRVDDMFQAAGYRIGPTAIENCLVRHRAVANAAVVPKPDAEHCNIVKAYIVLTSGTKRSRSADDKLMTELQTHVRRQLAPCEYPKEIEFIDELPMTTTGKVQHQVLRLLEEERFQQTQAPPSEP